MCASWKPHVRIACVHSCIVSFSVACHGLRHACLHVTAGDHVTMRAWASWGESKALAMHPLLQAAAGPGAQAAEALTVTEGGTGMPRVPWGVGKILQVMLLWLLAYILIGQVAVPMVLAMLGLDRDYMSMRGLAVLHLCLDLSQLGVTLLILWRCLRDYQPQRLGLFPVRWRGAWPLLVLLSCAVFPLVDWVANQSMSWFQPEAGQWSSPLNQMEHSMSLGDWVTNGAYSCVVILCAPIWEEVIVHACGGGCHP